MIKNIKLSVIIFLLFMLFILCGCEKEGDYLLGYPVLEYVNLFDYKNISVSEDYLKVSDDEIETVIEADLDSKGIYKEIKNRNTIQDKDIILCDIINDTTKFKLSNYYIFTDSEEELKDVADKIVGMRKGDSLHFPSKIFEGIETDYELQIKGIFTYAQANDEKLVLDMYECDTMDEVHEYVKKKTSNTIVFNYAIEKIIDYSIIKNIPEQADEYVEENIDRIMKELSIEQTNELEEYLGVTLEEYKESQYNMYFEYMIYVAIAEKENILFSQSDLDNTIKLIAERDGISEEDVLKIYDDEYITYEMIFDEVEKIIVNSVIIN